MRSRRRVWTRGRPTSSASSAMANRTSAALAEAEGILPKAIALDPKFALAWVGLADTLMLQTAYFGRPESSARRGRAGSGPGAGAGPEPSRGLGLRCGDRIRSATARARRTDVAPGDCLNPNYAPAHHWLSISLADARLGAIEALASGRARGGARSAVCGHQQLVGCRQG